MSFFQRGFLQVKTPFIELKRFRSKVHIRRPRKPCFDIQLLLDMGKPKYPQKPLMDAVCSNLKDRDFKTIDNPFQHILARDCANWFNHSKMIGFFHLNSLSASDLSRTTIALRKENIALKKYSKVIVHEAISDTPYEEVYRIFNSHTMIAFSEKVQPDILLKIMKKCPQLIFLAGVIDGKFLSKNSFVEYSQFPSLDVMRSRLCNVLLGAGVHLTNQLMQHQISLVNNLDAYVKMKQTENEEPKDSSNETEVKTE